jgi:hypothetical protein
MNKFDHTNITEGCANCHNGTTATGLTPNHLATDADCATCHVTTGWLEIIAP